MYIAEIWQMGGCDYSIECGTKVLRITNVSSMEEAKKRLRETIEEDYSSEERELTGARIYEVAAEETIEIADIYLAIEEKRKQEASNRRQKEEWEQYKRLKSKFGQ